VTWIYPRLAKLIALIEIIFIKAQRSSLLSLINKRASIFLVKRVGPNFGNFLIRDEVIVVRRIRNTLMWLFYK